LTKTLSSQNASIDGSNVLQRAFRNFGKLLRGRGVAAVLELLTVALLARELGTTEFGKVVLVQTYILTIRGLLNLYSYQVLVRFGVPLLESGESHLFKKLLRITQLSDFLSVFIATVAAIALAAPVGMVFGWDSETASLSMIYSVALLSYGFGTAKGVLRIYDRYGVLSTQIMIGPVLRLAGVVLVMMVNPTLLWFVIALTITTAIGNFFLIVMGWRELRRQLGTLAIRGPALSGWRDDFEGLRKFVVIVYWQGNVDMLPRHMSTLLAGAFLGPAGAGLLRLARESTKILAKPGALLRQVLYPDLVRMWVRRSDHFRAILVRAMLISMLAGLVLTAVSTLGGAPLLGAALGADYAAAAPLLSLFLVATTVELMTNVLRAAGYAMGFAGTILKLHLFSSVLYLAAFSVLTPLVGLTGPGFAACLAAMLPLVGSGVLVVREMRAKGVLTS